MIKEYDYFNSFIIKNIRILLIIDYYNILINLNCLFTLRYHIGSEFPSETPASILFPCGVFISETHSVGTSRSKRGDI